MTNQQSQRGEVALSLRWMCQEDLDRRTYLEQIHSSAKSLSQYINKLLFLQIKDLKLLGLLTCAVTVTEYQVPGLRSVKVYSSSDVGISWSSSSPGTKFSSHEGNVLTPDGHYVVKVILGQVECFRDCLRWKPRYTKGLSCDLRDSKISRR